MKLSPLEIDVLKIKIYKKFYEENKELYRWDPLLFFFKQYDYYEKEIRKYLSNPPYKKEIEN